MQLAAHVLAYNVNRFIAPVLKNIEPFVDKIYVARSDRPFGYGLGVRDTKSNPTTLADIQASGVGAKLEIVEGDWIDETSMRNDCLDRAKAEGFDWLITQDADEFYEPCSWERLRSVLRTGINEEHLSTTWYNFWRSSQYVLVDRLGAIKQVNAGFALRCRRDCRFVRQRLTSAARRRVVDAPCYHYGYVMSNQEMLEKLSTWSHAREFDAQRWFRTKWINWCEATRNLHPTSPRSWPLAIRFPLAQPDFAEQFSLPVVPRRDLSLQERVNDWLFDGMAFANDCGSLLKGSIRSFFVGAGRRE